jgi:hypothetical protein
MKKQRELYSSMAAGLLILFAVVSMGCFGPDWGQTWEDYRQELNDLNATASAAKTTPAIVGTPAGTNLIVAPSYNCAALRLTAPLDGMANGWNRFYWDPIQGAESYLIVVSDGSVKASYSAASNANYLDANVGSDVIGGGYTFTVSLHAIVGGKVVCSTQHTINRAASAGAAAPSAPDQPAPTATPMNLNDQLR